MRTPIEVIASVEGNGDDMYLTLPVGEDVAADIVAALEAEGYVIVPHPNVSPRENRQPYSWP